MSESCCNDELQDKKYVLTFLNGNCLYVSTHESGGGHRVFGEKEGSKSNTDDARRAFLVTEVHGHHCVELDLPDGRNLYVSENIYAGGHALFAEPKGTKSNTCEERRKFVFYKHDHHHYELRLKDGRSVYISAAVHDGGHGVFCEESDSHTNNDVERRHFTIAQRE